MRSKIDLDNDQFNRLKKCEEEAKKDPLLNTQRKLAYASGIPYDAYKNIFRPKKEHETLYHINKTDLEAICRTFEVTMDYIKGDSKIKNQTKAGKVIVPLFEQSPLYSINRISERLKKEVVNASSSLLGDLAFLLCDISPNTKDGQDILKHFADLHRMYQQKKLCDQITNAIDPKFPNLCMPYYEKMFVKTANADELYYLRNKKRYGALPKYLRIIKEICTSHAEGVYTTYSMLIPTSKRAYRLLNSEHYIDYFTKDTSNKELIKTYDYVKDLLKAFSDNGHNKDGKEIFDTAELKQIHKLIIKLNEQYPPKEDKENAKEEQAVEGTD